MRMGSRLLRYFYQRSQFDGISCLAAWRSLRIRERLPACPTCRWWYRQRAMQTNGVGINDGAYASFQRLLSRAKKNVIPCSAYLKIAGQNI